jgi:hypothetical protein
MNSLINLASVGLIGQKAGLSTPIDQQLRSMLVPLDHTATSPERLRPSKLRQACSGCDLAPSHTCYLVRKRSLMENETGPLYYVHRA